MRVVALVLLLALGFAASGCASGIHHRVRSGENLYRIGKAYGVGHQKLARINRIGAPYSLKVGQELFIPGANKRVPVSVVTPSSVAVTRPARPVPVSAVRPTTLSRTGKDGFSWPVLGRVSSSFGKRTRGHHDGIDIAATPKTNIFAARSGRVIFSDRLSGYGNVVILEHAGGYTTVYAHNDRNLVSKGQNVAKGSKIATVGQSGNAEGWHLHFEIRKNNVARNPLYYLPTG